MYSTPPFRLETVIGHGVCDGILAIRHLKESVPSALVPITAVLIAILLYIWGRIHSRQPEIFSCPFLSSFWGMKLNNFIFIRFQLNANCNRSMRVEPVRNAYLYY